MQSTVHIAGGGISGLAAGVRLAGAGYLVRLHEAAQQMGGRCRSYFDGATNLTIDNGNHLVLSGNQSVLAYAREIGSEAGLQGPPEAEFQFIDLATLIWASAGTRVGDAIKCEGVLYKRLVLPLLLAALNIDPPDGSAGLAGAIVRETLLAGGQACRPLIARDGLSSVLIEPAIDYIRARGGSVDVGHEVRHLTMANGKVTELALGDQTIALGPGDAVVMAVPPRSAAALLPGLTVPTRFRAIVNAHFRFVPPPHHPPMIGVVNGLIEWLFAFPDRFSITISGGDRLVDMPREELARAIWKDICAVAGLTAEMPAWQIVRARRATFEASPEQTVGRAFCLRARGRRDHPARIHPDATLPRRTG